MAPKKFVERWAVLTWRIGQPTVVFEECFWETEKAATAMAKLAIRKGYDKAVVMKSTAEFVAERLTQR